MSQWILLENKTIEEFHGARDKQHVFELYAEQHPDGPAIFAVADSRRRLEAVKDKIIMAYSNLADEPKHGWG
jgi:hypothetical protein